MRLKHSKMIGGILLVSGTTIGAGMLALPVATGLAGFLPTVCLFLLYWCYMTFTAFLMLEVNLWLGENINLITMAKKTLGRAGEVVSWITYLFLLYGLTTAYLAGGGPILSDFIHTLTGVVLPSWVGSIPLLFIFGYFVYEGTKYVDAINRFLMLGLVVCYGIMVMLIVPHVDIEYLSYTNWRYPLAAVSLIATSFGFHIIIPTLTTYMHHNISQLKKAILIGSIIPLVVYIIWEAITLGVIPLKGPHGIYEGYELGSNGAQLLRGALDNPKITLIAQLFSFFAIVTSFLGVTLSLSDFLADGLKIKKTHMGRLSLFVLTFFPPFAVMLTYPRAFLTALEFAGAFGVVILLGLLPPLMVWAGRYRKGYTGVFKTPGGKPALLAAIVFSFVVIALEIAKKTGMIEQILSNT